MSFIASTPTPVSADIFICCSSSDEAVAGKICEFLEAQDIPCWLASRNGGVEAQQNDQVLKAIQNCAVMLLLFSGSANESSSVRKEVDDAIAAEKIIIPFRLEDVSPTGSWEANLRRRYRLDAHTPPLERHLEQLVLLLKPLKHRQQSNPLFTAWNTSTLPALTSRADNLDNHLLPISREAFGPVRMLLNFDHLIVANCTSTFGLRLENLSATTLKQIELTIDSRGLEQRIVKQLPDIPAGGKEFVAVEILPTRSGDLLFKFDLKWREDDRILAFISFRSVRINEVPAALNLQNVEKLAGNSFKLGTPVDWMPALGQLAASGKLNTVQELLDFKFPESFEPLEFTSDYEISVQEEEMSKSKSSLFIPEVFLGDAQVGTVLNFEPTVASNASPQPPIRLVARPSFGLGRSRDESDYLTWFWPRNEIHDGKTRRLSKKQCVLSVRNAKIYVHNSSTASRTIFDGQEVTPEEEILLKDRGVLNLSNIYFIDVVHLPGRPSGMLSIDNVSRWRGSLTKRCPEVEGCVRFIPVTPHVAAQNSTWLLTEGTFGKSRKNAIIVKIDGLADLQGRVYFHGGSFWLESFANNDAVQVNDTILRPGHIIPLIGGQTVRLSTRSFRLSVTS